MTKNVEHNIIKHNIALTGIWHVTTNKLLLQINNLELVNIGLV